MVPSLASTPACTPHHSHKRPTNIAATTERTGLRSRKVARATGPACREPRAPSAGAATREGRSRCAMGSLAPPLPRPDEAEAARRVHTVTTHQRVPQPPRPRPWSVSAFTRTQTRHRRLSTRHRERQAAPNCLQPCSRAPQALPVPFSRAPAPLHLLRRSPTSAALTPRHLDQRPGLERHHRQPPLAVENRLRRSPAEQQCKMSLMSI